MTEILAFRPPVDIIHRMAQGARACAWGEHNHLGIKSRHQRNPPMPVQFCSPAGLEPRGFRLLKVRSCSTHDEAYGERLTH